MEACAEIRRIKPTDKRGHNYKTIPSLSETYVVGTDKNDFNEAVL